MSYCRWSTDVSNGVPAKELFWLLMNGVKPSFITKLKKRRKAVTSDWYIFWHCDNCIAVWNKHDKTYPCMDLEDVIDMYNNKSYKQHLPVVTQEQFLDEVIGKVVEDILKEGEDE